MNVLRVSALAVALLLLSALPARSCTNFIAGKKATADGSVMVTYTCDGEFHPILRIIPAADHEPGAMQEVKHWNGEVNGEIPYPAHTYQVLRQMNDQQVAIGETTTVGREELINPDGMLHYWQLMQLTLQRAATAREAVEIMGALVDEYGYRSSGESFAIGGPDEAWIMEMVGPGPGGKGAHWVAQRVPDDCVSAYANMGRMEEIPWDDDKNCLHSEGMVEFAREKGWYDPADGPFNWREAFFPHAPERMRYTATRVWSLFRRAAPSRDWPSDYHRGDPEAAAYPLWIKPDHKLSTADVFALMRDHYEGTAYDMTQGVDAGPFGNPYRWRPMAFEIDGKHYTWERPISTQQTGFSVVTQSRSWLPDPVGGLTWYGVDDSWFTCYVPLYCGIDRVPESYARGSLGQFSWDSAWWVFNFVSNFSGLKYSYMNNDIQAVQNELEGHLLDLQPAVERTAAALAKEDPELMTAYLTDYSVQHAEDVVRKWKQLGEYLITTYNDGYVKDENGQVREKGYPESWLRAVLEQRPDQFKLPETSAGSVDEPADY
jgi:dipeptidase